MKTLIVEDDFTSRCLLQELLKCYGIHHVAVNGKDAVEAVRNALEENKHYDLICLDIMMPEMDGQTALVEIRTLENEWGINSSERAKIVMTTALSDLNNVGKSIRNQCDGYFVKPISKGRLLDELRKLELIS